MKTTAEEFIREKIREKNSFPENYAMEGLQRYSVTGEDALRWVHEFANQFKSPPIVETDKLKEEFNDFCGDNLDDYLSKKDKNNIFDFFLLHLSGSKEVEVSDKEIEKLIYKIAAIARSHNGISFGLPMAKKRDLITLISKWMRDKQGVALEVEVEEKCIEVIKNKSVNPDVLKEGTVLIATNECFMNFTKEQALIIGKEYKIKGFYSSQIIVESEIDTNHYFDLANYTDYFKIKKEKGKQ